MTIKNALPRQILRQSRRQRHEKNNEMLQVKKDVENKPEITSFACSLPVQSRDSNSWVSALLARDPLSSCHVSYSRDHVWLMKSRIYRIPARKSSTSMLRQVFMLSYTEMFLTDSEPCVLRDCSITSHFKSSTGDRSTSTF